MNNRSAATVLTVPLQLSKKTKACLFRHFSQAPKTITYITKLVRSNIYDNSSFYRSDFVIQFGIHGMTNKINPHGDLTINETNHHTTISNFRGTAACAHFDVPDNGNSEVFINISDNPHLDQAYGGFCVFARVEASDTASFATMDAIAQAVKQDGKVGIRSAAIV